MSWKRNVTWVETRRPYTLLRASWTFEWSNKIWFMMWCRNWDRLFILQAGKSHYWDVEEVRQITWGQSGHHCAITCEESQGPTRPSSVERETLEWPWECSQIETQDLSRADDWRDQYAGQDLATLKECQWSNCQTGGEKAIQQDLAEYTKGE